MSTVTCTTVEKVGGSNNKFYRAYVMDDWCVFQFGPRTIAPGGGQWRGRQCGSRGQAISLANGKMDEEISEGYRMVGTETFEYNGTLTTAKADLQPLDHARTAAANGSMSGLKAKPSGPPQPAFPDPTSPSADPLPPPTDRHGEFSTRALAAVALAASEPQKAMLELALLREEFAELERIHGRAASYLKTLENMVLGPSVRT